MSKRTGRTGRIFRGGLGAIRALAASVAVMTASVVVLAGVAVIASAGAASAATSDRLLPGQELLPGQSIVSGNGQYQLIMQGDGNLVERTCGSALWNTGTGGHSGAYAIMQTDGNLVVYASGGSPYLWASWTQNHANAYLVLQNEGNAVIYPSGGGTALWSSSFGTGYTPICAGTKLVGGQTVFSPSGAYELAMQGDGNLVLYQVSGMKPVWNTGTGGNAGAWMVIQSTDGHFVVYSASNVALWAANQPASPGDFLTVQNAGKLVLYSSTGASIWSSTGLASVGIPSWWKGVKCSYLDSSGNPHANGNVLGTSPLGLISCGPGSTAHSTSFSPTPISVQEWQCVELSERWLYQEFGLPQQFANGNQVAPNYWTYIRNHSSLHVPLVYETPSTSGAKVVPGDVMSYTDGGVGHTAVVTAVTSSTYTIMSENWNGGVGSPFTSLPLKNGVPQGFTGYSVVGWLHYTG
jgi:CHAP domain